MQQLPAYEVSFEIWVELRDAIWSRIDLIVIQRVHGQLSAVHNWRTCGIASHPLRENSCLRPQEIRAKEYFNHLEDQTLRSYKTRWKLLNRIEKRN